MLAIVISVILQGIQDFIALEQLRVNDNNLSTIDLSQNTNLIRLRSYTNPLISLNLSKNTQLIELRAYDCSLLSSINIANGNNTNIDHLNISSNPNLGCVEVDNQAIADDWNNNINLPAIFSTSSSANFCVLGADETYIPDDAFEAYLEANSLGNGIANDNRVDTSLISAATVLNIGNLGILEVTGIEAFTALESFQVNDNDLQVIYLENLINLTTVRVTRNNLTKLDLSNQPNLLFVIADSNNLSELQINSTVLETYQVSSNDFSTIDFSVFPLLKQIFCSGNDLTSIDVSSNLNLEKLECQNNDLFSIDVSGNSSLTDLRVNNNQLLTSLNVKNGNNGILINFSANNTMNLMCIEVDNDVDAANGTGSYAGWTKDSGAIYSE